MLLGHDEHLSFFQYGAPRKNSFLKDKCQIKRQSVLQGPYMSANNLVLFIPVEGARVFARWTNGLYYRGFVTSASSTTVFITYDEGNSITLQKKDTAAVILDKLPCYKDVQAGQRVIGFLPGKNRYYPGDVVYKRNSCSASCYQKAVYRVLFDDHDDDTDQRVQDFHQIRLIPCSSSSLG